MNGGCRVPRRLYHKLRKCGGAFYRRHVYPNIGNTQMSFDDRVQTPNEDRRGAQS